MGQCEDDIKIPFPVVHSILIRREQALAIRKIGTRLDASKG